MPERQHPSFNHTRGDSALTPCDICARLMEEHHASILADGRTRLNETRRRELAEQALKLQAVNDTPGNTLSYLVGMPPDEVLFLLSLRTE